MLKSMIAGLFQNYWYTIRAYLELTEAGMKRKAKRAIRQKAREIDDVLFNDSRKKKELARKATSLLEGLEKQDKRTWADFLASVTPGTKVYVDLKELSPFANDRILKVTFNGVNVELGGEIMNLLVCDFTDRKIAPGTYVLVLPKAAVDNGIANALMR